MVLLSYVSIFLFCTSLGHLLSSPAVEFSIVCLDPGFLQLIIVSEQQAPVPPGAQRELKHRVMQTFSSPPNSFNLEASVCTSVAYFASSLPPSLICVRGHVSQIGTPGFFIFLSYFPCLSFLFYFCKIFLALMYYISVEIILLVNIQNF